jgi:hypothetical protein
MHISSSSLVQGAETVIAHLERQQKPAVRRTRSVSLFPQAEQPAILGGSHVGRSASGRSGSCETTRSAARNALTMSARLACFVCVLLFQNQQPLLLIAPVVCHHKARACDGAADPDDAGSTATDTSACSDARVCKVRPDVTEEEPLTFLTLSDKVLEACRLDATTVR